MLQRLTVKDCSVEDTQEGYHRLPSDIFRNSAPRLTEVVLTNVGWPEAALHASNAVTSLALSADFPLTDDLRSLIRDCRQLRALTISAPSSKAGLRGLPVLQNLKRLTATIDLGSLLTLYSVLPPGLEHFNIAEYGRAAAPSDALLLISLWTADRKTVSVYLARNLFAVSCEGTAGVRVLQKADGSDFLSVNWLRGALPRTVTSLDISLIDWSIIANALKDVELCALTQLTVRFARESLIPEDLPVHSQLTLRCPNLRMLVLQDLSLYWTLPLSNIIAFLRDCLCCATPENVRICPRSATIVSDTESREFASLTTPQLLSEVVANGGGAQIDEFAFWEDPEGVLTHFAPQAYRYYRMGPHAVSTAYEDD